MPKPPPTSGVRMRTLDPSILSAPARMSVNSQPPCVQVCRVMAPAAVSKSAIAARGSMALATKRLLTTRSLVTWAALANAASTAARSPYSQSKETLPGTSSCTSGWPDREAVSVSAAAGSDSYSTATSSAASFAWLGVSATTNATLSPTWRTRSMHSTGRSLFRPLEPSRFSIGMPQGRALPPVLAYSAAVITASTPGAALAASMSMDVMRACASGERTTCR